MFPARTLVAVVSLLTPVVAEERLTIAAQAFALDKIGDYGLELLQKQVLMRAAPTGWSKPSSSAALPPAVAPELLETISDLSVQVHTGDQRTAGFGLMIEDIQDGLEKATDAIDEISASQKKTLAEIKGQPLTVKSAMEVDMAAKDAETEAQLAQMAGDVHLRANRLTEKVENVRREFQDLNADLSQIQLGDMHVGELRAKLVKGMPTDEGALFERTERFTADAVAADAMKQAIKSGDGMRAKEDSQREDQFDDVLEATAGSKREEKQAATLAAVVLGDHAQRAVGISQALDAAIRAMKVQDQKHLKDMLNTKSGETESRKAGIDIQTRGALAAKKEAVVGNQARAMAELESEKAKPVATLQKPRLASPEAVEVAAKVVSAPWVEAARRVEELTVAGMADQLIGNEAAMSSVAALQKKPAATTISDGFSKAQDLADSAAQEALEASAQTWQQEAEAADAAAAVKEAQKRVEMQLEHHEDVYPSIVESEDEDFSSPTPEDIAEEWMDSILQGQPKKVAQVQKKPAVSHAAPLFEQQYRAAAAADQAREATAQTKHDENKVEAAVAAVEEARDRVRRRLVNHENLNPTPEPPKDESMMTPEEVAEEWMDSIVQSGQVAGPDA